MTAYDAIVIATGQACPCVTSRLAGAGMRVAVIERNAIGGTCVNTGCSRRFVDEHRVEALAWQDRTIKLWAFP